MVSEGQAKDESEARDILSDSSLGIPRIPMIKNPISVEVKIKKFNPEGMNVPYVEVKYTKTEPPWYGGILNE